jgi:hypothetical protein
MKIVFKLSTPEAVEYANAQSARKYGMDNNYFHLPSFGELKDARISLYTSIAIEPGYTDVTPNFLEDYYRPWKDNLASEEGELFPVTERERSLVIAALASGFMHGHGKNNQLSFADRMATEFPQLLKIWKANP